MFAPALGFAGHPVASVVVRDGERGRALRDLIEQWGARVVNVTADQHDRVAAAAQALTHAAVIAFGAALAELDVDIADLDRMGPPPHTALLSLLARIASGAPEVYWDVQAANPHAPAARRALSRGVSRLTGVVEDGDRAAFGDLLDRLCRVLGPLRGAYRERSAQALRAMTTNSRLAAMPELGGGNLLKTAMAVHPDPHIPFIRTGRPVINTAGEEQTEFTLAQLDALVQSWSVWYHEQGVGPRDRVALYMEDTFAYTIHLNALAQLGAIGVLINSKASPALALGLCQRTTPVGIYTDRSRLATIDEGIGSLDGLRWVQLAEDLPAPPPATLPDAWRFKHAAEDPVSIMHSSGTTGIPKAVTQTHASSVAGPRFRLENYTEPAHERMMTAQPQSHLGCIVYTAYSILAGTPLVALYDPTGEELAAAVRLHRPNGVMAFAHAYAELAALETPSGTVDSVDYWVNMGDAIHEAHIGAILAKRSPDAPPPTFYDRFGTTELGWGLVVQPRTLSSERSDRRVGKPDPVAEVAVLRADGSKAPVGEVGFFGAKGPSITAGYWNDSDTTYRSKLGGYWLTGDLVYQDVDGNYFVVDRTKDAIETAEGTGYSVLMEEVLLSEISAISDCAVVAGRHGDQIVPVAVIVTGAITGDSPAEAERLLVEANYVLEKAGHPHIAVLDVARTPDDFPVGVTGKVLKRELRDRYSDLAGSLLQENRAVAAFMTDTAIAAVVR